MVKQITPEDEVNLNTFPPIEDQLRQKEVAVLFGKSVQTIIKWKKKKIIPFYLIGVNPIFSRKQLAIVAAKNQHLLK